MRVVICKPKPGAMTYPRIEAAKSLASELLTREMVSYSAFVTGRWEEE
jgi:hypothetical protein